MTDPTQIAAKLSKAQREAVLKRERWPDGRCVPALQRLGLLEQILPTCALQRWTPLGTQVRSILAEKEANHG